LGYEFAIIQAADSTRVADENFLGFALGEKLRSRSSIAPHTAKKEQKKIDRPRQSTRIWLAPVTAAAFPGSPQPGGLQPKAVAASGKPSGAQLLKTNRGKSFTV
jgi:hypothetical protein